MLLALLACQIPPADGDMAGAPATDDSADDSAATVDSEDSATVGPIVAPATEGILSVPFDVSVTGYGTSAVEGISIAHDVGPLSVFGAKQDAVIWLDELWNGTTLYFTLSIPDDGSSLNVTYLYCEGEELDYVYALGFGKALTGEDATGKCPRSEKPIEVPVSLPAISVLPEPVAREIDIDGDRISLHDGHGTLALDGIDYGITPFGTVDCSACATPGWYELHLLLMRKDLDEACYGVLYLFENDPDTVELAWTLCVPSLTAPAALDGELFEAPWSGSIKNAVSLSQAPRFWHPPPRTIGGRSSR